MEITIKHFEGQYPSFNIMLHSAAGSEPFLEIKGCKIVSGANGDFISYPSRKQENGKYWNHVYGGEKFNAAVLAKAQKTAPRQESRQAPKRNSGFDDMSDDVPF
jgi:DNA-binding cell septation regulator SpoVG